MLNEKKSTCCHRCGHVHVKGTSCPKPFLKGDKSCARKSLKEDDYSEDPTTDIDDESQSGDTDAMGNINERNSLAKIVREMHTMADDGADEHHQLRADVEETDSFCVECLIEYLVEYEHKLEEAEYKGRKVTLGKPFLTPGGPKKRSVYVKNAKGNVIKVNFGDPNLKIKKNIPARRKAFRARHKCATAKDRTSPRYWSCKAW